MSTTLAAARHRIQLVHLPVDQIKPDPENARKHSARQLTHLRASISHFGFTAPILADEHHRIIAGHARLEAAKAEGLTELPCVIISDLNRHQRRALAIADNRIAELAVWDEELLKDQLLELIEIDFNAELTGFNSAEIDLRIEGQTIGKASVDPDDVLPQMDEGQSPVTRPGDLYQLGEHRLLCGNSLLEESYTRLLEDERAQLICSDAPFNVKIQGHVSGLGRIRHSEFAMASGEMSPSEYTKFLTTAFKLAARFSIDGSIHFQFIDFRHMREMLAAGDAAYTELKALCIWNKGQGGMGSLWRSQYELVFVWKNGTGPHINNVELGRHGRYRTNVWTVPGLNSFRKGREEELAMHPTVKPVGLIADAIRDCSKVGGLVLDPFGGSGTTIMAAERTKRRAALIEIDPLYVDVAIQRWQDRTGRSAVLRATGQTFAELADERRASPVEASEVEQDHD